VVSPTAPPAWRESTVRAGGAQLAVYEAGATAPDARVVLLVHGLGHWSDAAWGRLVPLLDPATRYLAFDLPGFGASEKPEAPYDLPYFRSVVNDMVNALGIDRFALAGHSLGGLIAADYAGTYPERVTHLILIAPAGFARSPRHLAYGLAGTFARGLFTRTPSRKFVTQILHRSVFDPTCIDAAVIERAYALSQERALRMAFARVYSNAIAAFAQRRTMHATFAKFTGPVFCACGARDRYIRPSAVRTVERVYPQARSLILGRSAHAPAVEEPDFLAAALHLFLNGYAKRS
jgi:abhydrolase domain-containing protein 6